MFELDFMGAETKRYLHQQGFKKKIWKRKNLTAFCYFRV